MTARKNFQIEKLGGLFQVFTFDLAGGETRAFTAIKRGDEVALYNGRHEWGVPADEHLVRGHQVDCWQPNFGAAFRRALSLAANDKG